MSKYGINSMFANNSNYLIYITLFILGSLVFLSGCVGLVVGGAATAVGTYAITHDYVTTSVDVSFAHAWKVANEKLKEMGDVDESHQKIGEIRATVNEANVKVTITKLTEQTVDIKVAARDNIAPKTDLARGVLSNIIRGL